MAALEGARLVNEHRSLMGYTGTCKGKPVSVQTSGIGTPSFSIVTEELLHAGGDALHQDRHVWRNWSGFEDR